MSIRHISSKIKAWTLLPANSTVRPHLFVVGIIVLTGLSSFFLGRITSVQSAALPLVIETTELPMEVAQTETPKANPVSVPKGAYTASKSGTKYHLPTCSGARSISEANKIWFATKEEAEKAGYTPAANCPGLK